MKRYFLKFLIFSSLVGLTFTSCGNHNKVEESDENTVVVEEIDSDPILIQGVVRDWNKSLNLRDADMARKVYAPSVFFYTKELSAEEGIKLRQDLVISDPSFVQEIISDVSVEDNNDGTKTAWFTKQAHSKKGVNTYRAYLVMKKIDGEWKIIKESDELTDKNVAKRQNSSSVPANAIRGDFDGDGRIDNVWIDAKYDGDGFSLTPLKLKSDNPSLETLSWNKGLVGVALVNLGDLNGSNRDFLGAIPHGMSSWCIFETYGFKNDKWKPVLDSFQVWLGDENLQRVYRADKPGYVFVNYNDMGDLEDFTTRQKQVKLNF